MARFLISHRLSGKQSESARKLSRAVLDNAEGVIAAFANVVLDRPSTREDERRTIVVEGDPRELEAKRRELPQDLIVEPQMPRLLTVLYPMRNIGAQETTEAGIGATVELSVLCDGAPVFPADVTLLLAGIRGLSSKVYGETDANGVVILPYDPRMWTPAVVIVVPQAGVWAGWQQAPRGKITLSLPRLPRSGPLGWWHQALGVRAYSERQGEGIRVGVVDTGVGPHPYLAHVESAGAFLDGGHTGTSGAGEDVAQHGTHVAGIIGARPTAGSSDFAGIAPGAHLVAARVYSGGGSGMNEALQANNGDIANAIDELSGTYSADIISLSSAGPQPSEIEADALALAIERGSVLICAAGNGNGSSVLYPAAYPQAVSVSAVGIIGGTPFGTLDSIYLPLQLDRYAANGLYSATFNSIGLDIKCTAPGVGIISTVPGKSGVPYVEMSGTSMAAPSVAGALATILSKDVTYREMQRGPQRALRAWTVLLQTLRPLGLYPQFQGWGFPTAWPQ